MPSLRETKLGQHIAVSPLDKVIEECRIFCELGKDISVIDDVTRECYLHMIAENVQKFKCHKGSSLIYLFALHGINVDQQDENGDTFLHKIICEQEVYILMIAALRCGANAMLRNNDGQTVCEHLLSSHRSDDWEDTYNWLQLFKPGLQSAISLAATDDVERLLKLWCQPIPAMLKPEHAQNNDFLWEMRDRYAPNIKFAHSILSGRLQESYHNGDLYGIDINNRDPCCSFRYKDNWIAHRPLLLTSWENKDHDSIGVMLLHGVDTGVLFSFDPCNEAPKPLFFHLLNPMCRPCDKVVYDILRKSDVSKRNAKGQTLLHEAVTRNESCDMIRFILQLPINIAARDAYGQTARDLAMQNDLYAYCALIDSQVLDYVRRDECEVIESYFFQQYDHIADVLDINGESAIQIAKTNKLSKMLELLNRQHKYTTTIQEMFEAVDCCNQCALKQKLGLKTSTSRDLCGRTVLHKSILNGDKGLMTQLCKSWPHTIDLQDSLGRTPLHYAYTLLSEDDDIIHTLLQLGASTYVKDVEGRSPSDCTPAVIGKQKYIELQRGLNRFSLDVFLEQSKFEQNLHKYIRERNLPEISKLLNGLRLHGNVARYSDVLFDLIDKREENVAIHLVSEGMDINIFKEYERSHVSLLSRAKEMKCDLFTKAVVDMFSESDEMREMETQCSSLQPSIVNAQDLLLYGLL